MKVLASFAQIGLHLQPYVTAKLTDGRPVQHRTATAPRHSSDSCRSDHGLPFLSHSALLTGERSTP
jgi:hypothetical protein